MGAREALQQLGADIKERFQTEKRVLSFEEYLAEFLEHPWRHSRDASRYMRDCVDHFGAYEVETGRGSARRYRLFDQEFVDGGAEGDVASRYRLVGHEALQEGFYRELTNFVQEGRCNRLLMLHGPNGSAKSTFAACVMRGLEHYSETGDGALYRFAWVFPAGEDDKTMGFGPAPKRGSGPTSYAHFAADRIRARLVSPLREHPLLLIPPEERARVLEQAYADKGIDDAPPLSLLHGRLEQENAQIYDALLAADGGDLSKVFAHVQVERYYLSRRYRTGAVTIGPQMTVDAGERQITADRTLAQLPAALSGVTLFESFGELVDGAGGLIEYSDLLKRPLDAWKYLLLAIETGEIALQHSVLPINSVLLASTNEGHLAAFREHPEYNSFRARLSMLRVGYLLDYLREMEIYDAQIVPHCQRPVAPHAIQVAALWAVLTRLRRSSAEHYEEAELGKLAADLSAMEKAMLYASAVVPARLGGDEEKLLRAGMPVVTGEFANLFPYEGIGGVSPREMRTLLMDAAQRDDYTCLSPLAVLDQIVQFCEEGDYEFLREKPDGGYHDPIAFVGQVRGVWLDIFDGEVRAATGLVDHEEHARLFSDYVSQVSLWVKGERGQDPHTGEATALDETLFERIEQTLEVEDTEAFRHSVIAAIAAHAIDNPDADVEHEVLFKQHLSRLQAAYFAEHRQDVGVIVDGMAKLLTQTDHGMDAEAVAAARGALDRLASDYGHCDECLAESLGVLLQERYGA